MYMHLEFKQKQHDNKGGEMDEKIKHQIEEMITSHRIFLFMKGTPAEPQCGFSMRVLNVLQSLGCEFGSCNILEDQDIRQGVKDLANWPTFPQLYIDGKFVGGCDIVEEMMQSGDLKKLVNINA